MTTNPATRLRQCLEQREAVEELLSFERMRLLLSDDHTVWRVMNDNRTLLTYCPLDNEATFADTGEVIPCTSPVQAAKAIIRHVTHKSLKSPPKREQ